jgi:hypothetical protein
MFGYLGGHVGVPLTYLQNASDTYSSTRGRLSKATLSLRSYRVAFTLYLEEAILGLATPML